MQLLKPQSVRLIRGESSENGVERVVNVIRPCVDCPHTHRYFHDRLVGRLVGSSVADVVSSLVGFVPILFLGHEKVRIFIRTPEKAEAFVQRLRRELYGVDVTYHSDRGAIDLHDRLSRPFRQDEHIFCDKSHKDGEAVLRRVPVEVEIPNCPVLFAVAPAVSDSAGFHIREDHIVGAPCASYSMSYAVCDVCSVGPLTEIKQLALWEFTRPLAAIPEEEGPPEEERLGLELRRLINPVTRKAAVCRLIDRLHARDERLKLWTLRYLANLDSDEFIKYFQHDFYTIFQLLHISDSSPEHAILSASLMAITLSVVSRDLVFADDGVYLRRLLKAIKPQTLLLTPLLLKCYAAILVLVDRVLSVEVKIGTLSQHCLYLAFDALYSFSELSNSLGPLALANMVRIASVPKFFDPAERHQSQVANDEAAAVAAANFKANERNGCAARAIMRAFRWAIRSGNSGRECFPAISIILAGASASPVLAKVMADRKFPFVLRWLSYATGVTISELTVAAKAPGDKIRLTLDLAQTADHPEEILRHL